ncbi:hypothetical protein KJA13_03990 [Patescibacteria group bacterium]|nr:hypothetical protein [Patescibacteria group bacterium]
MSLLLTAGFAFAQKELEIEYPDVPGGPGLTSKSTIPDYVKYIFNFAIWASGFLALGVLIYGGFQYLTSTGNVEKVRDAKERIASALLGLLILFGSYLILVSINPQLVIFHIPSMYPTFSTLQHGVLICKEQADVNTAWDLQNEALDPDTSIERKRQVKEQLEPLLERIYEEQCYHVGGAGDIRKEFDKWGPLGGTNIQYIYFIPDRTPKDPRKMKFYGAIIYEDKGFKDKSAVLYQAPGTDRPYEYNYQDLEWQGIIVSSIRPFVFSAPGPEDKAILYEETDFNWGTTGLPGQTKDIGVIGIDKFLEVYGFAFTPQSVEIKGNYIVLLCTQKECEVFIDPGDYDLNNNKVAYWQTCYWHRVPYPCKKSHVEAAVTIRAKLY